MKDKREELNHNEMEREKTQRGREPDRFKEETRVVLKQTIWGDGSSDTIDGQSHRDWKRTAEESSSAQQ
jgi:hypothetical protein